MHFVQLPLYSYTIPPNSRNIYCRYKEVAEHEGLLSGQSSDEEGGGDEIEEVTDFDQGLPLSLQVM